MRSDAQPQLLRRMNVRRILEVLRDHGASSRADLTRLSGISAPTVSKVVSTLIDSGLVEEGDPPPSTIGRPGRLLQLATSTTRVIGVALDAKRCWLTAAGFDGRIADGAPQEFEMPANYEELLEVIVEMSDPLIQDTSTVILGMGISTPGLINSEEQLVLLSPNLPITNEHRLAHDLTDRLGIDCLIIQEANALALAERTFGAARGHNTFGVLDVTTGLGLGMVVDGELLTGEHGFAGEIGHITIDLDGLPCGCGNLGCLETVATDRALCRLVGERLGQPLMDMNGLLERITTGQVNAAAEIEQTAAYLSVAIAMVINVFNPTAVFVHSRQLELDGVYGRVLEMVQRRALKPPREDCQVLSVSTSKLQGALAGILHHLTDSQGPRLP